MKRRARPASRPSLAGLPDPLLLPGPRGVPGGPEHSSWRERAAKGAPPPLPPPRPPARGAAAFPALSAAEAVPASGGSAVPRRLSRSQSVSASRPPHGRSQRSRAEPRRAPGVPPLASPHAGHKAAAPAAEGCGGGGSGRRRGRRSPEPEQRFPAPRAPGPAATPGPAPALPRPSSTSPPAAPPAPAGSPRPGAPRGR